MNHEIVVREYARLTTADVQSDTLDQARISPSAFRWICQCSEKLRASGAALVRLESRQSLCLDNYVGVIETSCGTRIEILPKYIDAENDKARARQLLIRMLEGALKLPSREVGPATLHAFRAPISEWLMGRFLQALDQLVKRGVRFIYHRIEEERRFLRGRLDVAKQVRRPPGRQHCFDLQHDVFDPNRPENRLLRLALERVCHLTKDAGNWRVARELETYLSPISRSQNVQDDFRRWQSDRLMASYKDVKP